MDTLGRIVETRSDGKLLWLLGATVAVGTVPLVVDFLTEPAVHLAVGIVISAVAAGGVIYGALWVVRSELPSEVTVSMTDGAVLGAALMALLTSPVVVTGAADRPIDFFRTLVSIGMLAGLLVGYSEGQRKLLRRQTDRLQTEHERLEFLNSLLRHDVQNKLTVISGNARFQLEQGVERADTRETLEAIIAGADEIESIIDDIRILTERQEATDPEPIDAAPILDSEISAVESEYDLAVEADVDPELWVRADDLLSSVFRNLLQNAAEHNTDPSVTVEAHDVGDEVRFRVADDGTGIPEAEKESLFELDPESGYGLYIVRRLVEGYGGSVEVSDNEPTGTEFVVRLPGAE